MDSRWDSNPGLVKTAGIVLVLKCSAVFEGSERRPSVSRRPRRRRKRRHRRRYDCSRLGTFHKGLNVTHRDALSFIFNAASPSTLFYGGNFFSTNFIASVSIECAPKQDFSKCSN